jgi:CRP-like cAMP-binding protein
MSQQIIESLRRVQIFSRLDDSELLQLASQCKVWKVAPDHTIFREGDDGEQLYIIQEGRVRILLNTRGQDGAPTQGTINTLHTGQSFGELVLLDGKTRTATVSTLEQSVLLVLHERDFARLCESNPRIGYRVMRDLAGDLAYKLRSSNLLLRGNIRWQHDELGHSAE